MVAAQGASHEFLCTLGLVVVLGRKPAFKDVLVLALEVQDFHGAIMTDLPPMWEPGASSPQGLHDRVGTQTHEAIGQDTQHQHQRAVDAQHHAHLRVG